jgi:hypothetical protein
VTLRIGFDLDGVLADMESALVDRANELFGEEAGSDSPAAAVDASSDAAGEATGEAEITPAVLKRRMTARQQRRLWKHVESIDDFWETLSEIEPGTIERLAALAADRRWEIIFLTKRPESAGRTAQRQTQRWLAAKGFELPSVFVVQGSRGRIAASLGLDIVVDDRPENCLDVVVDSKARAILVWRQDENKLPMAARRLGIGVVRSTSECLDILSQIHDQRGQPGVVDRVLRLLGLKQPTHV